MDPRLSQAAWHPQFGAVPSQLTRLSTLFVLLAAKHVRLAHEGDEPPS
jgi:hypothetical protein